jgi:DNA-binding transcriptional LysR family regulator
MAEPDWNLIRSFVAVAEEGSLSAAARRLSSSQPTIGRHIAELEAALGLSLFRRGRRGYEPTETGLTLLERARLMNEHANAFLRLATGSTEEIGGTVRITASEVVSAYVLPDILARLGEAEPAIEIELVASNRLGNLLGRDADIAIRMTEPTQLDLIARKIAEIPIAICAARSYLERRGRPQGPEDLPHHDLVGFDRDNDIIAGFRAFGVEIDRHAFRLRTDHQITFWEAVRAGNGIGFAQKFLVERDPLVEVILPDLTLPSLPMWLALHRDVRTSRRIRRVADFLFEELKRYASGQRVN